MSTIAITGSNRGIGLELTRIYAGRGDRVFAFCRDPASASALNALAEGSGGQVSVHAMDVGDGASIAAAIAALGGGAVDVLINNAGVIGGTSQSLESIDFEAWIDALKIMTIGPFRVAQALLPNLRAAAGAKIMTVTSQIGATAWPFGGYYAYASAKGGVNRVMQSMARDLKGEGIAVGLVHPGWVQTDMGGAGADISPAESAQGIAAVIDGLSMESTGGFFKWTGEAHPW